MPSGARPSTFGAGRLRVLHVMECTIGGTRRHIVDVAGGLVRAGVEVHLALSIEREPAFRRDVTHLVEAGCVLHEIPMAREIRPARDFGDLCAMTRVLRAVQPEVVHTHSSKGGVLGRLASLRTGIGRRVHTPHTFAFLFREMFGPLKRRVFFQLERSLARRTDRIVAVSESEARTFSESGVVESERIVVVPNGIDPAPYEHVHALDAAAFGLDPERPLLAVVGLLNPAKGQDLAIDALASPGCEEAQLVFAGEGPERAALEARAEAAGVARRVRFLGWRDDVPAILSAADLVLLPSRWEGMPYIVLEAFASGTPVLATPVDGALDLIEEGETGWLSGDCSAPAIGRALAGVLALSRAERLQVGARAKERVAESYTSEAMVSGLIDLYRSLL